MTAVVATAFACGGPGSSEAAAGSSAGGVGGTVSAQGGAGTSGRGGTKGDSGGSAGTDDGGTKGDSGGGEAIGGDGGTVALGGALGMSGRGGMSGAEAGSGAEGGSADCPRERFDGDGVFDGSVTIASAADAEGLQPFAEITGDLRVVSSFEGVLELRNLRAIGGSLMVESALIEDNTVVDWGRMTELRLPNLLRVGGQLYIYLTDALVETDFRSLESVESQIFIHRNLALRRLGLDSLRDAPTLYVSDCFELAQCELDAICQDADWACNVGGTKTGCRCETACGRVEPHC